MKVLFIINPCSGRGKIKNEILNILRVFCKSGYEVTTYVTSGIGEAIKISGDAKNNGYERIICCGGDGTLNEVITGVMQKGCDIPISYIPAGTTNDFAKTHGLSLNLGVAAANITSSEADFKIDVGNFNNERYFSYIASFGLFTSVSYKTQQNAKNTLGHMAYVFEGIANLSNIEDYSVSFTADDKEYKGDYIYGGITNSISVGGIFKYDAEFVDLNDGLFEVLMIKKPQNGNDIMKIVSGVASGDFSDSTVFDFCKAAKITLNMPKGVVWTLDGEAADGKKITVIENIHSAITFIK